MKSKTNIFLGLFFTLILVFGCSEQDLLEHNNNNGTLTSNFGSSVEQVEAAINAAFHPITGTYFWGRIIHTSALLRSDEFNIFPFDSNTAMSTFLGKPGDRWAKELWQELYKSISRCNNIILNIDETKIADTTTRNNLIGQAYFLRAFDYWYLVNLFGKVPLVIKEADFDNLDLKQEETSKIWDQIIEDLGKAESMLPEKWEGEDLGRPTSGAATALKGKSYLYTKEWNKAHTTLNTLVGKYELLSGAEFGKNFGVTNENNAESVFELQFLGQSDFVWGTDIAGTGTMGNYHLDYAPPSKSLDKGHTINPWLKKLFEDNNDVLRRNETLAYDYTDATGYGGVPFSKDFKDDIKVAQDAKVEAIFSKKYTGMDLGNRESIEGLGTNVGNNWRIIRYADVLLMLAEALNEDGKTSQAIGYINQVRDRAGLANTGASSQTDVHQAIIEERAMELAGEGHRFFDLVRWGLADDYMGESSLHVSNGSQTYHPKSLSGGTFKSGTHELVWIPNSELDSNPNLKQNNGY